MSKIGTTEIQRLADLAQLELTPDELARFTVELKQMIEFVEQLQAVSVTGVEPTDQVTGLENVLRPDAIEPSRQSPIELLANAPELERGYIKVARVLE